MPSARHLVVPLLLVGLLCFAPHSGAEVQQSAEQPRVEIPQQALPIMPLDDVRAGMKGYGLSVFHGSKIEAFPVEVISIARDFGPGRGAIWIRCPDDRMQLSGPVQGMSGSPIFLWDQGQEQEIGEGGKLAGAFAFGYSMSKDCYVGVQPIELMRDVADRANAAPTRDARGTTQRQQASRTAANLARLIDTAKQQDSLTHWQTWQTEALHELLTQSTARTRIDPDGSAMATADRAAPAIPKPAGFTSEAYRLQLPMAVSAGGASAALAPLLEPMGITVLQAPAGTVAGLPPQHVDPDTVTIKPGSVMALPLAWGDLDLSATGTVTEVLPDGRVLAFGHAMFGQGELTLPMATGYVHFVLPSLGTSFKLGGSVAIQGTVTRDEASAIAGLPESTYETASAKVSVQLPDQEAQIYNYTLAHHPDMTPMMAAIVALESVAAQQNAPVDNTATVRAALKFANGRTLDLNTVLPRSSAINVIMQVYPAMVVLANNPYDSIMLEAMELDIRIDREVRLATLLNARIDRATVAPGQRLSMTLELQPFGKEPIERRLTFDIPQGIPDGDYVFQICDARTYSGVMNSNRPHRMRTRNADELFDMVEDILTMRNDALYLVMHLNQLGVAVGRQEQPQLPSSRMALMASPSSTATTPYRESVHKIVPMELVPQGNLMFQVTVRKELNVD